MKTKAYCALHRLWRMVDYFQGDRAQMAAWLDKMHADDTARAAVDRLWAKRYPKPRVTLETEMPKLRLVR